MDAVAGFARVTHVVDRSFMICLMSPLIMVALVITFFLHSTMAASGLVHFTHSTNAADIFGLS